MASRLFLSALLALCCASAIEARLSGPSRALLGNPGDAGELLASCPVGCNPTDVSLAFDTAGTPAPPTANGTCAYSQTSGGYECTSCAYGATGAASGLIMITQGLDKGKCGCPAGKYASAAWTCSDCVKGTFCPGGLYSFDGVRAQPNNTDCSTYNTDLTTLGMRATSVGRCVNKPGSYYISSTDSGTGFPSAATCQPNTWSGGLKKQRSCLPCPTGFSTLGVSGKTKASDCVMKAGYFMKSPGQVAPCPQGEYQPTDGSVAAKCTKCPTGSTTIGEASTAASDCKYLLPGYYATTASAGGITATKFCPQKSYCPGTDMTVATPTAVVAAGGSNLCPSGTFTRDMGATTIGQCGTPPGYYTVNGTDGTDGSTAACDLTKGQFRTGWVPLPKSGLAVNVPCESCGAGTTSVADDTFTTYDASGNPTANAIATTGGTCVIAAGYGVYYNALDKSYTVINCNNNNYGLTNDTKGQAPNPCRPCPAGMVTDIVTVGSPSNDYLAAGGGFTSPLACVTQPGWGYNGRASFKCPVGSYNPGINYLQCTKCPNGQTTADAAASQLTVDDCKVAPGFGEDLATNRSYTCPIGSFGAGLRAPGTDCVKCSTKSWSGSAWVPGTSPGLSTVDAGATTNDACDVCLGGYAGADCATACGGGYSTDSTNHATYGLPGASATDAATIAGCERCPQPPKYFFDYLGVAQEYQPAAMARSLAESAAECLVDWSQINDAPAWYLPGASGATSTGTLAACLSACTTAKATCAFVEFNYTATTDAGTCTLGTLPGGTAGTHLVAFKALSYAETGTALSIKNGVKVVKKALKVKTKGVASGSYTFWPGKNGATMAAASPGTFSPVPASTTTVKQCLDACDADIDCAGVTMTGAAGAIKKLDPNDAASGTGSVISTCTSLKGDSTFNTWKRGMVRMDYTQLDVIA